MKIQCVSLYESSDMRWTQQAGGDYTNWRNAAQAETFRGLRDSARGGQSQVSAGLMSLTSLPATFSSSVGVMSLLLPPPTTTNRHNQDGNLRARHRNGQDWPQLLQSVPVFRSANLLSSHTWLSLILLIIGPPPSIEHYSQCIATLHSSSSLSLSLLNLSSQL